jgi:hydrogenase/urease accessory protein HupE
MVPAHLPAPGFEGFYVGLLHPFAEAEQFLAIAAAGLFWGQQPRALVARTWRAFPAAAVGGMLAGLVLGRPEAAGLILYALALLGGGLVALAPQLPAAALAALGVLVGGAAGLAASPDPGSLEDTAVTAAGALAGVNAIALYGFGAASWASEQARWPWLGIGVRVIGSWIVAIAFLMLALALQR